MSGWVPFAITLVTIGYVAGFLAGWIAAKAHGQIGGKQDG